MKLAHSGDRKTIAQGIYGLQQLHRRRLGADQGPPKCPGRKGLTCQLARHYEQTQVSREGAQKSSWEGGRQFPTPSRFWTIPKRSLVGREDDSSQRASRAPAPP